MKKVILDTNFILTCVKQKIDFFEDIKFMGIRIIIPKQVITELERISSSKKKLRFREDAKLALKLLEKNPFKEVNLKNKNVDKALIKLAKENQEFIIATLDRELKKKIKNQKLVIRGKKKLEVV